MLLLSELLMLLCRTGFSLDKLSVKPAVGYVMHQGIRDVADAAQARRLKRQLRGGNIDAHSANHDWNQFFFAEFQPEIINSFISVLLGSVCRMVGTPHYSCRSNGL